VTVCVLLAAACDGRPLLSINPNAPPTPGNLTAVAGDEEILLTWDDVAYSATQGHGFNVFMGTSPTSLQKVAGPFGEIFSFVARGLTNGTTYYFAVSAESFGAESARSAAVHAVPVPHYLVEGFLLGRPGQQVRVTRNGAGIPVADVSLGGRVLSHVEDGVYTGDLGEAPAPGASLTLTVSIGGALISGTDAIPVAATVTGPPEGTSFTVAELVPVAWQALEDPDGFEVRICWDQCAESISYRIGDGSARSFDFSPLGLPVILFSDFTVQVRPFNEGVFTGPHKADSRMDLRGDLGATSTRTVHIIP